MNRHRIIMKVWDAVKHSTGSAHQYCSHGHKRHSEEHFLLDFKTDYSINIRYHQTF